MNCFAAAMLEDAILVITSIAAGNRLGNGEVTIGAVWNHGLARLKMKLFAIELQNVRLDLLLGVSTAPRRIEHHQASWENPSNIIMALEDSVGF